MHCTLGYQFEKSIWVLAWVFSKTPLRPWELKWMNLNTVSSQMCFSIIYYCVLLYNDSENLKICKVFDSSTCQSGFKKEINVIFWVKKLLFCGWCFQRRCLMIGLLASPTTPCFVLVQYPTFNGLSSSGGKGRVNICLCLVFRKHVSMIFNKFFWHLSLYSSIPCGIVHCPDAVCK